MDYMQPNLTLESSPKDNKEVEYIVKVLKNDFNLFETPEESNKREEILISLKKCVKEAVKNVYKSNGKTDEEANSAGGGVFSFGSYRLGIVGPGDDIDVLCIAPDIDSKDDVKKCGRYELFEEMRKQLEKLQKEKNEITQILPVTEARVPIIKIVFKGIPIDILVATVSFKSIDENFNLDDDNVLKNCCDKCILSLNGCRVTNAIFKTLIKTFPIERIDDFRITLRAIKLWAKKRGIYSNAMGYLGGVAWAILVAKICQLFPKCRANILIRKFFEVYGNWDWENPVQINEIKREVEFTCSMKVWEKDNTSFPFYIITPAFPAQNTNANTNQILRRVMVEEFNKFKEYSSKINIDDENCEFTWKGLFQGGISLFGEYNYFLQIDILVTNKSEFKSWDAYVESQLRKLISNFIDIPQIKLRPYSIGYNIKDPVYPCCKTYLYGISFVNPESFEIKPNKVINLRDPIKKFVIEIDKKRDNKNEKNMRITFKAMKDLPFEILQIQKDEMRK